MDALLEKIYQESLRRNGSQPEFQQAVSEVITSIEPLLTSKPEYGDAAILERIIEPERQIMFRVAWQDDAGKVHVNRGYRIEFNSALGSYKGGLRFHPTVNLSVIKFLGFEQIFKNALTGQQIGGAKGGSDFDPHGKSDGEIMRFCQAFMTELYRHIGPHTDVPAGDIGVGSREIGYLYGQYKRITNRFDAGVLTGKGANWGGSLARTEATGYGTVLFAQNMLNTQNKTFDGKTVAISGSGNVAIYAAQKAQSLGAKVVTVSDSSGSIYDPEGIDVALLQQVKEVERARISEYARRRRSAEYREGVKPWGVPAQIALPCATQNEVELDDFSQMLDGGVELIAEGANMPLTHDAIAAAKDSHVLYAPGKAANAGGVATSALEMQQNAGMAQWPFEVVEEKLEAIMADIHNTCLEAAEEVGKPGDYQVGANIAGFKKVAQAMLDQGIM
ncbi:glutamate dehydrogenase (NADP+) [Arcanobacterium pluranimalium]|uniref:NADP-specific glutamate dehydrogenase n=1 Tax=Arcanobacterium pluranimalium TaxID=108028 RepID=UPI00195D490E|nr:NADP-specific glutamate dehydrogenase [Arcanobacterium pluranimalium]MBM7824497.1 glutamate dehydrogenase (NADP+) [Arcanobacterium pluranimalium]